MPDIPGVTGNTVPKEWATPGRRFRSKRRVVGQDDVERIYYAEWSQKTLARPTWTPELINGAYSERIQPINGGGFRTGLYKHDGTNTLFTRGDVASFHRRRTTDTSWQALHDSRKYSGDPPSMYQIAGFAVAPSDVNVCVAISKSDVVSTPDGGATLRHSQINMPPLDGNDDGTKRADHRIAIDPRNPNHVLIGGRLRVHQSTDLALTWTDIATPITTAHSKAGNMAVFFDDRPGAPTGVVNGQTVTLRWWLACNSPNGDPESGFYRTDDGGFSFVRVQLKNPDGSDNNSGSVNCIQRLPNGDMLLNTSSDLHKIVNPQSSTYTTAPILTAKSGTAAAGLRPGDANNGFNRIVAFAFNPNDPNVIVASHALIYNRSGYMFITYDGGTTWKSMTVAGANGDGAVWPTMTSATSNWTVGSFVWLSNGELWLSDGMGCWVSTSAILTAGSTSTSITFAHKSRGFEDIVVNDVLVVPEHFFDGVLKPRRVLMAGWDRSFWKWEGEGATAAVPEYNSFGSAWSIATCRRWRNVIAFVDTNHQPGHQPQRSGISINGGETFTQFGALPTSLMFGNIAISSQDPNILVWAPSEGGNIHWSHDQGKTWTEAGYTGSRGFHTKHYLHRNVLCADPYDGMTFYILNQASSSSTTNGILRSTDGGKTWAGMGTATDLGLPNFDKQWNHDLKAVPDGNGNTILFLTMPYIAGAPNRLYRGTFTNGVLSFAQVTALPEAYRVSEGAELNGVPVVWCVHRKASVTPGVLCLQVSRSLDSGVTWTLVADQPLGRNDRPAVIHGDIEKPNRCYLGFDGTGVIELTLAA